MVIGEEDDWGGVVLAGLLFGGGVGTVEVVTVGMVEDEVQRIIGGFGVLVPFPFPPPPPPLLTASK